MAYRKVEGRDYHYGPSPGIRHDGPKANCFSPECDLTHLAVSQLVRDWLHACTASSIVRSVATDWHNGCRYSHLYPVAGREAELRALVEDRTLHEFSRTVRWVEDDLYPYVEILH